MLDTATPAMTLTDSVRETVNVFATALADTKEFQAFEQAALEICQDPEAQQAVRLFQEKQRSLQMMQQLAMVSQKVSPSSMGYRQD